MLVKKSSKLLQPQMPTLKKRISARRCKKMKSSLKLWWLSNKQPTTRIVKNGAVAETKTRRRTKKALTTISILEAAKV